MTLIDGSIGFSPAFMWCGVADIPGMPSSSARDDWGAVTYFAGVTEGRTANAGRSDLSPSSNLRCAHRSVRHHIHRRPRNVVRICDSSAGFCLAETMGLRSGGSGMGGASYMAHRHIFL